MNNRIRNLDLRLSLPAEMRARSQQLAQELRDGPVKAVVARLAERFHARFGDDAIIEIGELDVTWEGNEALLGDFEYACSLGDELADSLLAELDGGAAPVLTAGESPRRSHRVTVYRDRIHQSSVRLIALALEHRQRATIAGLAEMEQVWRTLCDQGEDAIVRTAAYVGDSGAASDVCEALGLPMLELAVRVSPPARWPTPMRDIVGEFLLRSGASPVEAGRAAQPNVTQPAATSPNVMHPSEPPRIVRDGTGALPRDVGESPAGIRAGNKNTESPMVSEVALPPAPNDKSSEAQDEDTAATDDGHALSGDDARAAQAPAPQIRGAAERDTVRAAAATNSDGGLNLAAPEGVATRYAGLVYLLNLMLRIELPEILWCCGIDEGSFVNDVLRRCTRADPPDVLINVLSGAEIGLGEHESSEPPQWAQSEVVHKTHARLAHLARGPHFTSDLQSKVETLSANPNGQWSDAIAIVAEMLEAAFLDLVGAAPDDGLDAYVAIDGALVHSGEAVSIRMPMAAIDIRVRRAGLDLNPGLLVWSKTVVTIAFSEDDLNPSTSI